MKGDPFCGPGTKADLWAMEKCLPCAGARGMTQPVVPVLCEVGVRARPLLRGRGEVSPSCMCHI